MSVSRSFRLYSCLSIFALSLALGAPATGQTTPAPAPKAAEERSVRALGLILGRAQFVRTLAAQHLAYLDSKRATPEVHEMEDAAQVMAYSLICNDEEMDAKTLNNIANDSTLKIALLLEKSPVGQKIQEDSKNRPDAERLTLISDVASATLMFKIGRRRGLFDSLKTDFGTKRFCAGLGGDMRKRYETLAAGLGKSFN